MCALRVSTLVQLLPLSLIQTLHSICRIAEVLIILQQVGNVKYTGWLLQVPCSTDREIVHTLQQQAKDMEAELHEWREKVKTTRLKFYELNYYTTLQLLILRKEFGGVKNLEKPDVSPDSLALLQSISSQVSSEMVCDVVKCTPQYAHEASPNAGIAEHSQEPPVTSSQTSTGLSISDEIMAFADLQASARSSGAHDIVISDKPTLTEYDLSEDEKAIMANIIMKIQCPKLLVLKAFEECRGKEMDKYDYLQWCVDHLEEYKFSEEGDSDDEASTSESESESESDDQEFTSPHGIVQNVLELQ